MKLNLEITDSPSKEDEEYIVSKTREFNSHYVHPDVIPICVFARNQEGVLIGGLSGKTYWNYLDVGFLWVTENSRRVGVGSEILLASEEAAIKRGCQYSLLDTYSFQALEFYLKQGYEEFGRIDGFGNEHTRFYLRKSFQKPGAEQAESLMP